mmetsp:Transcript_26728/g.50892  ORF Transcript_26728/g.50892 Transcript_26728/m.50892 type:complete len:269 (+) Transcript_26728:1593-2399(+)
MSAMRLSTVVRLLRSREELADDAANAARATLVKPEEGDGPSASRVMAVVNTTRPFFTACRLSAWDSSARRLPPAPMASVSAFPVHRSTASARPRLAFTFCTASALEMLLARAISQAAVESGEMVVHSAEALRLVARGSSRMLSTQSAPGDTCKTAARAVAKPENNPPASEIEISLWSAITVHPCKWPAPYTTPVKFLRTVAVGAAVGPLVGPLVGLKVVGDCDVGLADVGDKLEGDAEVGERVGGVVGEFEVGEFVIGGMGGGRRGGT